MTMTNLININKLHTTAYLHGYTNGTFRFITKCRGGFYTISDVKSQINNQRYLHNPQSLITGYKKGVLQTVEFCPEGEDFYLTVFARVGKKIKLIDEEILKHLTVGTINSLWYDTNLYSQAQYTAVNAANWSHKAYILNTPKTAVV